MENWIKVPIHVCFFQSKHQLNSPELNSDFFHRPFFLGVQCDFWKARLPEISKNISYENDNFSQFFGVKLPCFGQKFSTIPVTKRLQNYKRTSRCNCRCRKLQFLISDTKKNILLLNLLKVKFNNVDVFDENTVTSYALVLTKTISYIVIMAKHTFILFQWVLSISQNWLYSFLSFLYDQIR